MFMMCVFPTLNVTLYTVHHITVCTMSFIVQCNSVYMYYRYKHVFFIIVEMVNGWPLVIQMDASNSSS